MSVIDTRKRIVIDPGHGGKDPGAIGPSGLKESDVNLTLAHLVASRLTDKHTVFMTRMNDDFVALSNRTLFANAKKADIFVSIHCNAATNPLANGTETYYASSTGARLAKGIHDRLVALGLKDRGIKQGTYWVLRKTHMPAVLVEVGFISHAAEEIQLGSTDFMSLAADAITEGILDYLGGA
jgi:N-acetylmuramoyl-L-alanine amidase